MIKHSSSKSLDIKLIFLPCTCCTCTKAELCLNSLIIKIRLFLLFPGFRMKSFYFFPCSLLCSSPFTPKRLIKDKRDTVVGWWAFFRHPTRHSVRWLSEGNLNRNLRRYSKTSFTCIDVATEMSGRAFSFLPSFFTFFQHVATTEMSGRALSVDSSTQWGEKILLLSSWEEEEGDWNVWPNFLSFLPSLFPLSSWLRLTVVFGSHIRREESGEEGGRKIRNLCLSVADAVI